MRLTLAPLAALLLTFIAAPPDAHAERCSPHPSSRPQWVNEVPRGYKFDYFVGEAEDQSSATNAKKLAVSNAVTAIVQMGLITVETQSDSTQRLMSDGDKERLINDISEQVSIKGHATQMKGLERVESYQELCNNKHRAYALVRVPKKNPEDAPTFIDPLWRSAIAPGWGQFWKGHSGRGLFIVLSEVVLVPTAITTIILSEAAADDAAKETTNRDRRDHFNQKSDDLWLISMISGSAAAAIYIYNLIDAAASKQDNVYAERPGVSDVTFAAAPAPNGKGGTLGLTLRF